MFRHPALFPALIGSYTQRETLFAEQNVSAVAAVKRIYSVVFGELTDILIVRVQSTLAVYTSYEIVAVAELVENLRRNSRHNHHIEYDVDTVGKFYTVFSERRTDFSHRERNDVHSPPLHCSFG